MEDFAVQIAEAGTAESITQVYDQYLNFLVTEPDLFSLGLGKETYWALNSSKVKDEDIDNLVDQIVSGLFSVVVTMGTNFRSTMTTWFAEALSRSFTNHPLSTGQRIGTDSRQAGQEVKRSHFEFKR